MMRLGLDLADPVEDLAYYMLVTYQETICFTVSRI